MEFFYFFLFLSILSCSLVTGFIFTYAIIVMPGLSKLSDKEFLKAFQVTDAVIQNKQPIFMLTWIGSIVSVLSLILISITYVGLSETWLIVLVALIYLLGVQGITIFIHLPLNNQIQKLNLEKLKDENLRNERLNFENKWNFFNNIRTTIAFFVSLTLLIFLTIT
ncbi:MAG: hypothetical protein CM15mP85_12090 [Rhodobacterales bacterium]|nr:MAG: hypothetical protein CM15mP85_12090 [Rhodobacterales bacterium]